mmetsp:Transcript_10414/g.17027  ORF Transcript_10414/g.17027 Transcript_10414/m.17027 type:complete len:377 (-) Transcript_10414:328-1458(-)|eukprot:CAMPEP_0184648802 /NCGR_PEP_ID=MMETSP0308-20130426/6026_1 /TAXON_ID=38269 /ORGANISM="Gloeochaete witrockiana, Strain SAG 46.84" /LENGTH=376 /DNA_ID=CAMNT_0027080995 /DNA_START=51 /DNA_END=1181 /DNA_ORIENTATION=-
MGPPLPNADVTEDMATPVNKLFVVLDMDETLIRSEFIPSNNSGSWRVVKRPGLNVFLKSLCRPDIELMLWTAGTREYAEPIINTRIDVKGDIFKIRWFRETTTLIAGNHVKDLSKLATLGAVDMSRIVIVDNQKESFLLQPTNGIKVKAFMGDMRDTALYQLLPFLLKLVGESDVRTIIQQFSLNEQFKIPRIGSLGLTHSGPISRRNSRLLPISASFPPSTAPSQLQIHSTNTKDAVSASSISTSNTERGSLRTRPFPPNARLSVRLARLPRTPTPVQIRTPTPGRIPLSGPPTPTTPMTPTSPSVSSPSAMLPIVSPPKLNLQPLAGTLTMNIPYAPTAPNATPHRPRTRSRSAGLDGNMSQLNNSVAQVLVTS